MIDAFWIDPDYSRGAVLADFEQGCG